MSFSQVSLDSITCTICPGSYLEFREQHDQLCKYVQKIDKYGQSWFTCSLCQKTFRSRRGIFEHLTCIHYPKLKGKKRGCKFCGNFFFVYEEYKEHLRLCRKFSHYMNLQSKRCLLCEMFFPWPCDFQKHFKLKHAERMDEILSIDEVESEEEKFDDMGFEGEIPEPPAAKRKKSNINHGAWNCIFCGITQHDYEGGVVQHTTRYCRIYLECIDPTIKQCKICKIEIGSRPFYKNVTNHFYLRHKEYIFLNDDKPTKGPYVEWLKLAQPEVPVVPNMQEVPRVPVIPNITDSSTIPVVTDVRTIPEVSETKSMKKGPPPLTPTEFEETIPLVPSMFAVQEETIVKRTLPPLRPTNTSLEVPQTKAVKRNLPSLNPTSSEVKAVKRGPPPLKPLKNLPPLVPTTVESEELLKVNRGSNFSIKSEPLVNDEFDDEFA